MRTVNGAQAPSTSCGSSHRRRQLVAVARLIRWYDLRAEVMAPQVPHVPEGLFGQSGEGQADVAVQQRVPAVEMKDCRSWPGRGWAAAGAAHSAPGLAPAGVQWHHAMLAPNLPAYQQRRVWAKAPIASPQITGQGDRALVVAAQPPHVAARQQHRVSTEALAQHTPAEHLERRPGAGAGGEGPAAPGGPCAAGCAASAPGAGRRCARTRWSLASAASPQASDPARARRRPARHSCG